jgi:phosphatidate cytidylyltransferase
LLKYRIITALILVPLVIAALFWLPPSGFAAATLVVCVLAAWEWGQFCGLSSRSQRVWLAVLCGLLLTLMLVTMPAYQHAIYSLRVSLFLWLALAWWCLALLMVMSYPNSAALWRDSIVLRVLFGVLTLVPFFWGMVALRQVHYGQDHYLGAWWLLYVMLLVWGADSGAYAFGRLFGKHKLAPKVSPGKTLQGLAGGLLTAALISWLFARYVPLHVEVSVLLSCSILATLASVLGDLTESMFKREAGIKDSGNLIQGHVGILDRIDSLTAAVPVFACLMLLVYQAV